MPGLSPPDVVVILRAKQQRQCVGLLFCNPLVKAAAKFRSRCQKYSPDEISERIVTLVLNLAVGKNICCDLIGGRKISDRDRAVYAQCLLRGEFDGAWFYAEFTEPSIDQRRKLVGARIACQTGRSSQ